jgi:hypothetical protein
MRHVAAEANAVRAFDTRAGVRVLEPFDISRSGPARDAQLLCASSCIAYPLRVLERTAMTLTTCAAVGSQLVLECNEGPEALPCIATRVFTRVFR